MGCGALAAWAIWKPVKINNQIKSFFCGFLGIFIPAVLIAFIFLMINYGKGMAFIVSIYLPAALIEGLLTIVIYNYFNKVKPEILK
jgi:ABC-type Co2+ transport system permease subunit